MKTIKITIPKQLEILCRLLSIDPADVVQGFVNDLAQEVVTHGSDERMMAKEYFLRCGHGISSEVDFEHIEEMFHDLDSIRWKWPGRGKDEEWLAIQNESFKDFKRKWSKITKNNRHQ